MDNANKFNNYEFIKLDELDVMNDIKIVLIYARFMRDPGITCTIETHSHSFYELHFALSGSCRICLKNSIEKVLKKGEFLLINPNTNHKFSSFSDDFFRLSVVFDIHHNGQRLAEDDEYIIRACNKKIRGFLEVIMSECQNRENGYGSIINFQIYSVMVEIFRQCPEILSLYGNEKKMQNVLKDAITFIRNNISLEITTADVARGVNLSTRQLNRIFNSNISMTVPEFIRGERISRVCEHLEKTNLSLREIAGLTGFNDEYILCKTFKKLMGNTPGRYRANNKQKGLEEHYEKLN